jgi:hypothetical protein
MQASPLHAPVQAAGAPHSPSAEQVSTLVSLAQRVSPGLQTPPQSPATQASSHSSGADHRPPSPQRCTSVIDKHSAVPVAHSPD